MSYQTIRMLVRGTSRMASLLREFSPLSGARRAAGLAHPACRLDHTKSNMVIAGQGAYTPLQQIVERTQRGELGSTEMPPQQVW